MKHVVTGIFLACAILIHHVALAQQPPALPFKANPKAGSILASRSVAKNLGPALSTLVDQGAIRIESAQPSTTWISLCRLYGLDSAESNPLVQITVWYATGPSTDDLATFEATLVTNYSKIAVVRIPLNRVEEFALTGQGVVRLDIVAARQIPDPKAEVGPKTAPLPTGIRLAPTTKPLASAEPTQFDKSGATGKGTIVAVLDTGLDFKHTEFLDKNGRSRVLYLYDMADDSFEESGGTVGSAPPFKIGDKYLGTLYTKAQLDQAISGDGTVNSFDYVGHGTACTGIAAGSDRGVAPEASIIFVKIMQNSPNGEYIGPYYASAAQWIKGLARELKMPVSMSMSFGSQYSSHNGSEPDEQVIDEILATDNKGLSIAIAAGNEGRKGIQANSKFGKNDAGQIDRLGEPVQTYISSSEGSILGIYNSKDDWGMQINPVDSNYESSDGSPLRVCLNLYYHDETLECQAVDVDGVGITEDSLKEVASAFVSTVSLSESNDTHRVFTTLPQGQYWVTPFGYSGNVVSGKAVFYGFGATFGYGGSTMNLVGSPGNALRALTVGAHVGVTRWDSLNGVSKTNLTPGSIASFSSPGPRIDGVQKPEITAPGNFIISALSRDSKEMGAGADGPDVFSVTPDSKFLAWSGTSAATPFVAGVVALMFEKNPDLTCDDIKQIIVKTAKSDTQTSSTPNPLWGYGKIDGVAAVAEAQKRKN